MYHQIEKNLKNPYKKTGKAKNRALAVVMIALFVAVVYREATYSSKIPVPSREISPVLVEVVKAETVEPAHRVIKARVTGYNTVKAQTDQTPCISATGDDICGRNDVVACPRNLKLGTKVEIDGKTYFCLDRTAKKFDGRFDISCDKDFACPGKVTGTKEVKIYE